MYLWCGSREETTGDLCPVDVAISGILSVALLVCPEGAGLLQSALVITPVVGGGGVWKRFSLVRMSFLLPYLLFLGDGIEFVVDSSLSCE